MANITTYFFIISLYKIYFKIIFFQNSKLVVFLLFHNKKVTVKIINQMIV